MPVIYQVYSVDADLVSAWREKGAEALILWQFY